MDLTPDPAATASAEPTVSTARRGLCSAYRGHTRTQISGWDVLARGARTLVALRELPKPALGSRLLAVKIWESCIMILSV